MRILITGGLGFIGVNTAEILYKDGHDIFILDNMSRKGNFENLLYLQSKIEMHLWNKDLRNFFDLKEIFENNKFDAIIHLAAQVAVTSSVKNPREDFETNSVGTFNLLECIRIYSPESTVIYSSTNKVYGNFKSSLDEKELRYVYSNNFIGIDEEQCLDFHSPYGCSKGTADQYMRDYNRIFGLKTVVLRQSCIYGPNQFGVEDQGWVSWFSIASLFNKKFTIYGDGKQVRDVLHVFDLVNLYKKIIEKIDICSGKIYNVGGGHLNTLSLLELIDILEFKLQRKIEYDFSDWRPGDQKIYVSNINKIHSEIEWTPEISINDGISNMINWIENNENVFSKLKLI